MLVVPENREIARLVRILNRVSGEARAITVKLVMRRFNGLPGIDAQPPRRRPRNAVRRPTIAAEGMKSALPVWVTCHRKLYGLS